MQLQLLLSGTKKVQGILVDSIVSTGWTPFLLLQMRVETFVAQGIDVTAASCNNVEKMFGAQRHFTDTARDSKKEWIRNMEFDF